MLLATQPLWTLDRRNVNLQVGGGKEEYQFPAARPVVGTDCGCTSVHKASLRLQNLTNQVEKRISLQTISFWVERVILSKLSFRVTCCVVLQGRWSLCVIWGKWVSRLTIVIITIIMIILCLWSKILYHHHHHHHLRRHHHHHHHHHRHHHQHDLRPTRPAADVSKPERPVEQQFCLLLAQVLIMIVMILQM